MGKPVRILLVEDSQRDEALLLLYLRTGGFDPTLRRVQTAITMKAQLESAEWDLVISDFNLPGFDAHAALKVLRDSGRQIPLIVVSSEISSAIREGLAAAGVADYVAKYEMKQIVPIIQRLIS